MIDCFYSCFIISIPTQNLAFIGSASALHKVFEQASSGLETLRRSSVGAEALDGLQLQWPPDGVRMVGGVLPSNLSFCQQAKYFKLRRASLDAGRTYRSHMIQEDSAPFRSTLPRLKDSVICVSGFQRCIIESLASEATLEGTLSALHKHIPYQSLG